jgi:hypothetical protein
MVKPDGIMVWATASSSWTHRVWLATGGLSPSLISHHPGKGRGWSNREQRKVSPGCMIDTGEQPVFHLTVFHHEFQPRGASPIPPPLESKLEEELSSPESMWGAKVCCLPGLCLPHASWMKMEPGTLESLWGEGHNTAIHLEERAAPFPVSLCYVLQWSHILSSPEITCSFLQCGQ